MFKLSTKFFNTILKSNDFVGATPSTPFFFEQLQCPLLEPPGLQRRGHCLVTGTATAHHTCQSLVAPVDPLPQTGDLLAEFQYLLVCCGHDCQDYLLDGGFEYRADPLHQMVEKLSIADTFLLVWDYNLPGKITEVARQVTTVSTRRGGGGTTLC